MIRELQPFLPTLEYLETGSSERVGVPLAAGSVSFLSRAKMFDTGTKSLSLSSGNSGKAILLSFFRADSRRN